MSCFNVMAHVVANFMVQYCSSCHYQSPLLLLMLLINVVNVFNKGILVINNHHFSLYQCHFKCL